MEIYRFLPKTETSLCGSTLKALRSSLLNTQRPLLNAVTTRVDVLKLAIGSAGNVFIHTGAAVGKIAVGVVQLPLHSVWGGVTTKLALTDALSHMAYVARSMIAAILVPLPALVNPNFSITAYRWLALEKLPEGILANLTGRCTPKVLLGLAITAVTAAGFSYYTARMRTKFEPSLLGTVSLVGSSILMFGGAAYYCRKRSEPIKRPETRPETHPDIRPETRPETHPDIRPETRLDIRPETRPETHPDIRPETRLDTPADPITPPEPHLDTPADPIKQPEPHPVTLPDPITPVSVHEPKQMLGVSDASDGAKPDLDNPAIIWQWPSNYLHLNSPFEFTKIESAFWMGIRMNVYEPKEPTYEELGIVAQQMHRKFWMIASANANKTPKEGWKEREIFEIEDMLQGLCPTDTDRLLNDYNLRSDYDHYRQTYKALSTEILERGRQQFYEIQPNVDETVLE